MHIDHTVWIIYSLHHFHYEAHEPRGIAARGKESTYCSQLIKLPKEFVEQFDQFLSGTLRSQAGETHDVCKQDAVGREKDVL